MGYPKALKIDSKFYCEFSGINMNYQTHNKYDGHEFKIRDARIDEVDDISKLLVEANQQYVRFYTSQIWQGYLENITDVRSRLAISQLIAAEIANQVVGTVTLYLDDKRQSEHRWPEGWAGIRLLAVHPAYRGRGIARALMEECVRRCRSHGVRTIGLHTTGFMDVARHLYERMGFKRMPELDFEPASGVIVMAYRLDL